MKNNITRRDVLAEAVHDCYKEMYAKAQPSADWDQIIQDFKDGKYPKDTKIYERHYLSQAEYLYITEKYMEAYRIKSEWKSDCDLIIDYLEKGGTKDKWIDDVVHENGFVEPGHRGYEDVPPLKEQFFELMKKWDCSESAKNMAEQLYDKAMETIKECRNFYKFDREEGDFKYTCALGASPTSNPQTVIDYWKSQGKDIEIEERCPKLFWYYDQGYTDEEIEEEFEKTIDEIKQEWKEEKEKEKEINMNKMKEKI